MLNNFLIPSNDGVAVGVAVADGLVAVGLGCADDGVAVAVGVDGGLIKKRTLMTLAAPSLQ